MLKKAALRAALARAAQAPVVLLAVLERQKRAKIRNHPKIPKSIMRTKALSRIGKLGLQTLRLRP